MVAAVLGPLLGGVLGAVTNNVVALTIKLAGKGYDLWSNSDNDIDSMKGNLGLIARLKEEELTEELCDLALEFEDLLDRALRHVVKQHKDPLYKVFGFANAVQLKQKVNDLKKRLNDAYQRRKSNHQVITTVNTYTTEVGPVGISESKREIWEWVMKDVEGEPEQRSVISVVGFSGSGKSTLVKEVFDCPVVASKFPHRAFVVASAHNGDAKMILMELLQKLGQGENISKSDDVQQLRAKISDYLKTSKTKRYLIVLDDLKNEEWWGGIMSAFPEKATGRIIVTTTNQRAATVCSRENGYVHNMEALDDKHSKELLKAVLKKGHSTDELEQSSMSIRNKCDGHPHALVTVAKYLQGEYSITKSVCDKLCSNLGFHMETEDSFIELQKALINHYKSLPKGFPNLKTCLLYICVFPNGCNISRSRLIRRWCAEGYVQHDHPRSLQDVAEDNIKKLVEQSIFWPIDTSKDASVKICRAHGIFHEFMLQMSKSAKFITSYEDPDRRNYRHLFIQNKSRGMASNVNNHCASSESGGKYGEEEESRAHSLTLCGKSRVAVGYITKCALLRVLDVEECEDLMDGDLDGIHELYHLKYLSIGKNITRPPNHIEKMYYLETLDMRKTKKEIALPVEVIQLPILAHLLGKFKIDNKSWDKSKPEKNLPEKSILQTLAGFVTDHEPGFQLLMDHMNQLRKVKIWLNSTGEDPDLKSAIEKFVGAEQDTGLAIRRSLSLDFRNSYGNILLSLTGGCLRSLKLHGELKGLVHFVKLLYSLKELCLSSTNDLTAVDLSVLRELSCLDLEYLKLVGVSLGGFVIRYMDFRGLRHLCLVQCPSLPTIEEGALPNLLSLRLLNQELDGLSGFKIECHEFLQEIALDSEVKPETKSEWKNAAKNHQKRPRVLYLKRVSPDDATGSMVKYVATEKSLPGPSSSNVLGKRPMATEQSNSFDKHSSKQVRVADLSPASAEIFSAMEIDMMPSSSRVFQTLADDSISHRVKHQVSESI